MRYWGIACASIVFVGCNDATELKLGSFDDEDTGFIKPTDTGDSDIPTVEDLDGDGFTTEDGDCNDNDPSIHPEAIEICDSIDNDCDSLIDDADDSIDPTSQTAFYTDEDQDGFGRDDSMMLSCEGFVGMSANGGDCEDQDATIHPEAIEICDNIDQNCDGIADDGFDDNDASGTPDCREVALIVSFGFQYRSEDGQCDEIPFVDREVKAVSALLNEMNLEVVTLYEQEEEGITSAQVVDYSAMIYHNGGWADPIRSETLATLVSSHRKGLPVLVMGDDVANQINRTNNDYAVPEFYDLVGMTAYLSNSCGEYTVTSSSDTSHPFLAGSYGVPTDFGYVADIDALQLGESEDIQVAMQTDTTGYPVSWSVDRQGPGRVAVLMTSAYNSHDCPIADEDGLNQIAVLFKNTIEWLRE